MSSNNIFQDLNNTNRSRRNTHNSLLIANNNNNLRPPPNSRPNSRGRSSAFSENFPQLNNISPNVVPVSAPSFATAATVSARDREKLAESFTDNYWRIINLFLLNPRVLKHITINFNTTFSKIPGAQLNKLLKGSQNILENDKKSTPRTYYKTRKIIENLLKELASKVDINEISPDDFFMKAFGLTEDEVATILKQLHPDEPVLLNSGKYSEKFMHVPGRFYKALLDFYLYGDIFLEWRSTTDILSRQVLDYVSSGKTPTGFFSLSTLTPFGDSMPKNSELVEEYILFDKAKKPDYVQNTTSFPIYDLKNLIESLMKTQTIKDLFKNKAILKMSPGIRTILEKNPENKVLLNMAFPPSPAMVRNNRPKPVPYQTRRLLAKGFLPGKPTRGGRIRRQRRTTKKHTCK
ncbi:MAG: hypothetical protein EBT86_03905 [Actinobacteria bacterium]|nr:hypothetical protein [Actinomycetota bacterium]